MYDLMNSQNDGDIFLHQVFISEVVELGDMIVSIFIHGYSESILLVVAVQYKL